MTRIQMYLILGLAFIAGWTNAYPYKSGQGHYVVTLTGDEGEGMLGSKFCTRGPSYWCHNITQAAECHAVKHCIQKVWENPKEKLPEDNDSVCKTCLDMVQQARDQLLSNETQDELRQVLEGSCNLIPLKLVAKECRELADDFIPELIDALTSRMDPQMVCHISGLCNSVRIDEMLAEMKIVEEPSKKEVVKPLDPSNFDTCPQCEYFIGQYTNCMKNLTKGDLRIKLLKICGYLGSYSDSCRHGVTHELDAIYEYIQKNMQPKDICSLIGLCVESTLVRVPMGSNQQAVRVWQPPKTKDDDMECDFCKQITESVRQWLVANNTEDEFEQVLQGLCKQTGRYKSECLNLVQQYGKQIYDTLVNDLNPDAVCRDIGVCPGGLKRVQLSRDNGPIWTILAIGNTDSKKPSDDTSSSSSSEEDDDGTMPLMKLLPGERLAGDDERNALKGRGQVECQFCEYALHYLQNYLDDAKTEEEIRAKVTSFCANHFPENFAQQCKNFVNEYGDALVSLLAQEVDASEICPRLRLCPVPTPPSAVTTTATAVGKPVRDILPTCALCSFTVEKLIDLIGKNMTKASIDAAMEGVCLHLPQRMEDDCLSFMKNYGDQVAEMVLIYGTAHGVCAAIHLCLLSPMPPTPHKIIIESQLPLDRYAPRMVTLDRVAQMEPLERDGSRKCVICEFVITTLDQKLQDNATEEEIKVEVEHICTYLPKTVQSRCQTFIETYGEQIIQYLSQEVDPEEICQRLSLCQPDAQSTDPIKKLQMSRCQLCMLISDYLSTLVHEEKSEQKIENLAKRTCPLLPQAYRKECNAIIEDYGEYLLNILEQETDKGKACAQIQLCPALTLLPEDPTPTVEDNIVDDTYEY